jgi:hypothetical protein
MIYTLSNISIIKFNFNKEEPFLTILYCPKAYPNSKTITATDNIIE